MKETQLRESIGGTRTVKHKGYFLQGKGMMPFTQKAGVHIVYEPGDSFVILWSQPSPETPNTEHHLVLNFIS